MSTLILFDVDGTLLAGSGTTHVAAFADALEHLTGAPNPFTVTGEALAVGGTTVNGLVDAQIARLCLDGAVNPDRAAELLTAFRVALIDAYRTRVAAGESCGTVLPGVVELLDELDRRHVAVGLVTGNTEEICAVKMAAAGLDGRFVAGGYGGELPDRAQLFSVALRRAEAAGLGVTEVCYVGDTTLDIDAARRAQIPIVAVATGKFTVDDLAAADAVVADLTDTARVADLLETTCRPAPAHPGRPAGCWRDAATSGPYGRRPLPTVRPWNGITQTCRPPDPDPDHQRNHQPDHQPDRGAGPAGRALRRHGRPPAPPPDRRPAPCRPPPLDRLGAAHPEPLTGPGPRPARPPTTPASPRGSSPVPAPVVS